MLRSKRSTRTGLLTIILTIALQLACEAAPQRSAQSLTGDAVRIYVADLPHKYNYNLLFARERGGECERQLHQLLANPTGNLMDAGDNKNMLRMTQYNVLDVYMHRQMLESPLRVLDLQQADLVYVPLYLQPLAYAHSLWSELDHFNRDATKEASQLAAAAALSHYNCFKLPRMTPTQANHSFCLTLVCSCRGLGFAFPL